MIKRCATMLALTLLQSVAVPPAGALQGQSKNEDAYPAWRAAAARTLASSGDSASLATAAALSFVDTPRSKADAAKAAATALELAVKATDLAPDNAAISWLRLQLCIHAPGCDVRDAATTMRWVDADNSAAWLPTLAVAQRDKDTTEVDRVLASMAQGLHFDLYTNRATVLMFDTFKRSRGKLPPHYLESDRSRMIESMDIAHAAVLPTFSPIIDACREAAVAERREACLAVSKTMQRADTVMAQLVGFAIERRLTPSDGRELRQIAERRHLLEWREMAANELETPLLPWLRNARARARLAMMRALPREEDVCIAMLRNHKLPLGPEEHR